jgi:hypothetical protein
MPLHNAEFGAECLGINNLFLTVSEKVDAFFFGED